MFRLIKPKRDQTMNKVLILTIFCFISVSVYGGSFKSSYDSRSSVVATVEIENEGVYNLIASVQFLRIPYDTKIYKDDGYEDLINRLSVEWRGVALNVILQSNKYKISDLSALQENIDAALLELINSTRSKYKISNKAEVVYSITSMYIVKPSND